ncbi:phosphopantothenoylcysteine decarboxylase/phosphopantothenate-cysteine ligase [Acididesulfobacillus acetoxydans]|uniref:Coenzyme A biosynthesis bifunctional protein CoaBC n=1 Tax=Acididesulfobacillus acetoxydans TaxID=1561005 RepID=A0A8S0X0Y0_9FIRM|nr:bifunctional phosphopantothenoylcysteine decarboxylase/phosphopantothenate--cysteine ligase CoaBC [Acididesulfobacillus acetoxydans]CAA7602831.1 phosphopantothenoylcysteine decarboxylase/phosphopantothenate-cysteine ligase [Acididesulfobacillus acetoxydans]CEJ05712.1 Coenzyme A biosynthesis bifunctional protein CoaBC [Acididesulfobacillus acetoxydans]
MLEGKKILVGITGGIAAYKAAEIVSRLRKMGADVHVAMTDSAVRFITPVTLRSLSGNPVHLDLYAEPALGTVEHVALAVLADAALIAPATANFLAKMAIGLADDFLSTVILATKAPLFVAPAMNHVMFHSPATQDNLRLLEERGVRVIGPASGFQACGSEGDGRMSEPEEIVRFLERFFARQDRLRGKRAIVTAGGTQEPIDPVRYLTNRSSGRMGYAVAEALQEAGAETILVSAPTALSPPPGVETIQVSTALKMREAVLDRYAEADIVVMAAAVADYRPAEEAGQKIKKTGANWQLELVPNPDILAELARNKEKRILVGFAAETENLISFAREKIQRKNLDMLVANDVTLPGAGFGSPTNIVSFLFPDGRREDLPQMNKLEVARRLVQEIEALLGLETKE